MSANQDLRDAPAAASALPAAPEIRWPSAPVGVPLGQAHLCPGHRRRAGPHARRRVDAGQGRCGPTLKTGADKDAAAAVGKLVAERALAAGVTQVVFDRGSYLYHGRVKALAEAAREGGLAF